MGLLLYCVKMYYYINYWDYTNMKFIAYKAFGNEKSKALDIAIAITSFSNYSHTELMFSDGMCFSSSGRDNGVRYKKIIPDPKRWDIFELDLTEEEESHIRYLADMYIKKRTRYDYLGALACGFHLCLMNKRSFCSEIVSELLSYIYVLKGFPCHYSPGKLVKFMNSNPERLR